MKIFTILLLIVTSSFAFAEEKAICPTNSNARDYAMNYCLALYKDYHPRDIRPCYSGVDFAEAQTELSAEIISKYCVARHSPYMEEFCEAGGFAYLRAIKKN